MTNRSYLDKKMPTVGQFFDALSSGGFPPRDRFVPTQFYSHLPWAGSASWLQWSGASQKSLINLNVT